MSVQIPDHKINTKLPSSSAALPVPHDETTAKLEKLENTMRQGAFAEEMLEQYAEQTEEIKSQTSRSSQSSYEENSESRKDSASLSERSRTYLLSGGDLEKLNLIWTLESEMSLWEALLNWMPSSSLLPEDLKNLELLFQALQLAILQNTTGKAQAIQLERLDQALSVALNRVFGGSLDQLVSFLSKYGTDDDMLSLKNSIYRPVTGHTLPEKQMDRFWSLKQAPDVTGASLPASSSAAMKKSSVLSSQEQGLIYSPGKRGTVNTNQQFYNQLKDYQGNPINAELKNSRLFSGSGKHLYTTADLVKAKNFIQYLERGGNLFEHPQLDGKSEELLGVISSIMSMKSQMFSSYAGVSPHMGTTIRTAMDKLIDHSLLKVEQNYSYSADKNPCTVNQKAVFKVYYYILNLYRKTGRPDSAILEGLPYALELFQNKKSEAEFIRLPQYNEKAGFFFEHSSILKQEKGKEDSQEMKSGKKLLENDWKDFIKSLGRQMGHTLPTALMDLSPWGMMIEQPHIPWFKFSKSMVGILVTALGMTVFLLLISGQ